MQKVIMAMNGRINFSVAAYLLKFGRPQRAITPGQLAIFYEKDKILGAAWIKKIYK